MDFGSLVTTIIGASIPIGFGIWLVGRQFRDAIKQNAKNQASTLKLEIYRDIRRIVRELVDAEVKVSVFPLVARAQLALALDEGIPENFRIPPASRVPDLAEKHNRLTEKVTEAISLIEGWLVVDPRMVVFRSAFNSALHDIGAAFTSYHRLAFSVLPADITDREGKPGQYWNRPSKENLDRFFGEGDRLVEATGDLGGYIYDFLVEMQNALLVDLFDQTVPPREPLNPSVKVVRLTDHVRLNRYFENETPWGRELQRTMAQVKENYAAAKPATAQTTK